MRTTTPYAQKPKCHNAKHDYMIQYNRTNAVRNALNRKESMVHWTSVPVDAHVVKHQAASAAK